MLTYRILIWVSSSCLLALVACAAPATTLPALPISAVIPTAQPSATNTAVPSATATHKSKPTATEKPATPTRVEPTPTITFAPHIDHVWNGFPTIVIVTKKNDPRIPEVTQAAQFWNDQLKLMGTPFRLGAITEVYEPIMRN